MCGPGELFPHHLLHFFSARAQLSDLIAATLRAGLGHLALIAAGVADQLVAAAVIGEWFVVPWAFDHITAVAAEDISGGPPAVEEQDRLLVGCQDVFDPAFQLTAEDAAIPGNQFIPHIHNGDLWQSKVGRLAFAREFRQLNPQPLGVMGDGFPVGENPVRQFDQRPGPAGCLEILGHSRGSGTQQDGRLVEPGGGHSGWHGMVIGQKSDWS